MNGTYVRRFILCVILEEVFVFHVFVDAIGTIMVVKSTQETVITETVENTQNAEKIMKVMNVEVVEITQDAEEIEKIVDAEVAEIAQDVEVILVEATREIDAIIDLRLLHLPLHHH